MKKEIWKVGVVILVLIILGGILYLFFPPQQDLACRVYANMDGEIKDIGYQCVPSDIVKYLNKPKGACVIDKEKCP